MPINVGDVAALTLMISSERLGKLMALTGSAQTAIELHQETLQLGASLMNVTATIEIALRNSVCENLSQHFAVPKWLQQPPITFQWRKTETDNIAKALDLARSQSLDQISSAAMVIAPHGHSLAQTPHPLQKS